MTPISFKLSALLFSPFLLVFLLTACATTPASAPPPWAVSSAAMQQMFPDSEFIARQGRGATRPAAEAAGAAAIAQFLAGEIWTSVRVFEQGWEGGTVQPVSQTEVEIFTQAQIQLFGVRHSVDAYFDRPSREWITVAYINRAEAWQFYGLRIRHQAEAFMRLFEAAENERDPFRRAMRYIAAQDFASAPEFMSYWSMGEFLFPARMSSDFAAVASNRASLPQRVSNARINAPVFIDIPLDFESIVQSAFSRRFAALGFPVTNNRNMAAAVCHVTVTEGRRQGDLGVFYYPHVQAVLSSPAGTLLAFSAEGGRQAAVNPEVARRRAYQALADLITSSFSLETNF